MRDTVFSLGVLYKHALLHAPSAAISANSEMILSAVGDVATQTPDKRRWYQQCIIS
jgi:hypothetical protein